MILMYHNIDEEGGFNTVSLKNFTEQILYLSLNKEFCIVSIDDYIKYWHEHETGNTLQEFLGLTDYECEQWGKSSDSIFRDIIFCRQRQIDFSQYNILPESGCFPFSSIQKTKCMFLSA